MKLSGITLPTFLKDPAVVLMGLFVLVVLTTTLVLTLHPGAPKPQPEHGDAGPAEIPKPAKHSTKAEEMAGNVFADLVARCTARAESEALASMRDGEKIAKVHMPPNDLLMAAVSKKLNEDGFTTHVSVQNGDLLIDLSNLEGGQ